MSTYIFLRTAWMKYYRGVTDDDIPKGGGSYVDKNHEGSEAYNFFPISGYYYGFAQIQGNKTLWLFRLSRNAWGDYLDGVTIIFFAKNPETGGQYIVGWYKNARLFKSARELNHKLFDEKYYITKAKTSDCYRVEADDRVFQVDGPGQSNVWYAQEYKDQKYFDVLKGYLSDPVNYIIKKKRRIKKISPWQKDAELRKQIEIKAMEEVYDYYSLRNYTVKYVHKENYGWDLKASLGKQTLLLEVKGVSGNFNVVDFTPNEYTNSKINKKHNRICIVSNALNKNKKLDIFYFENNWVNKDSDIIKPREIVSAKFILQ